MDPINLIDSRDLDNRATVIAGELFQDRWMSQEIQFAIVFSSAGTLHLTLWNPGFNRAFYQNAVTISLTGGTIDEAQNPVLTFGQSHTTKIWLPASGVSTLRVRSEAVMRPDALDSRTRSLRLHSLSLTPG